jgi:hypothetical protein
VDASLVDEGRLRILTGADQLTLAKRGEAGARVERDPALLLDLMLSALEG